MKLIEIDRAEFDRLGNCEETYFCNDCIFDEETDNLVAFVWYKDSQSEASKYYKVVKE